MIGAALLLAQAAAQLPPGAPACRYDRAAMLALDEQAFDQDLTGGWRALSDKGCVLAAADLIHAYRTAHPGSRLAFLSFWHEGQLRAQAGQTRRAVALFDRARRVGTDERTLAWNHYVDSSIAFLGHDRHALQTARDRLAALPRPGGLPTTMRWPMNLDVVDALLRCFGSDYLTAYGQACRGPT